MAIKINNNIVIDDGKNFTGAGLTVTGISTFSSAISAGGTTGTSGQVLQSTGAGVTWASGSALDVCIFDTSGTWTKPSNGKFVMVEILGAGGGGGKGSCRSSTDVSAWWPLYPLSPCNCAPSFHSSAGLEGSSGGTGGGGGVYASKFFLAPELGPTVSITVGAGGTGGTNLKACPTTFPAAVPGPYLVPSTCVQQGEPGCWGGDSSFGSEICAAGGWGGWGGFPSAPGRSTGCIAPFPVMCNYKYNGYTPTDPRSPSPLYCYSGATCGGNSPYSPYQGNLNCWYDESQPDGMPGNQSPTSSSLSSRISSCSQYPTCAGANSNTAPCGPVGPKIGVGNQIINYHKSGSSGGSGASSGFPYSFPIGVTFPAPCGGGSISGTCLICITSCACGTNSYNSLAVGVSSSVYGAGGNLSALNGCPGGTYNIGGGGGAICNGSGGDGGVGGPGAGGGGGASGWGPGATPSTPGDGGNGGNGRVVVYTWS
jgi:hypothetical protein